jgi:hypothetical protein
MPFVLRFWIATDGIYRHRFAGPKSALAAGPRCAYFQSHGLPRMSRPLDEFFAGVEDEFGVDIDDRTDTLDTPGDVIDYIVSMTAPTDGMDDEEHRDHVASVVGELMARTLGITRYREDSRFLQELRVR